jgi:hypothetical protein
MSERRRAIHWTELTKDTDGPLMTEWNFYLREIGRLLAEGQENRWLLIKGENIVGIWDTRDEAFAVASERFFRQAVLVKQIVEWEPLIKLPTFMYRCHN